MSDKLKIENLKNRKIANKLFEEQKLIKEESALKKLCSLCNLFKYNIYNLI